MAPLKLSVKLVLLGASHEKVIYGFQMNKPIVVFFERNM